MEQGNNNPFDKYPCNGCEKKHCIGHTQCLKWLSWFKKAWQQVTGALKRREG